MTKKLKLDDDDASIALAMEQLDRPVDVDPGKIVQNLARLREKRSRAWSGSVVATCISAAVVGVCFLAWSTNKSPLPQEQRTASIVLRETDPPKSAPPNTDPNSTRDLQESEESQPPLSLASVSDEDLRSLELERERLQREVAELAARQSKHAHNHLRDSASATLQFQMDFVDAF